MSSMVWRPRGELGSTTVRAGGGQERRKHRCTVAGRVSRVSGFDVFCTRAFHVYDSAAVVIGTEVASGVLDA